MKSTEQFLKGDIVRYIDPQNEGEAKERMVIVAISGECITVRWLEKFDDWFIAPTMNMHAKHLKLSDIS